MVEVTAANLAKLDCKTEKNTLGEEEHLGEYEEKANRIESLGTPNDPCDEE